MIVFAGNLCSKIEIPGLDSSLGSNLNTVCVMKIGLIGVGGHGQSHLRIISQLESEGLAQLVAVADPFREQMEEVASSLLQRGVKWFCTYEEMITAEPALDLIVISTPIHLHVSMVKYVLKSSNARILLEKPATATLKDLNDLIASDRNHRVRVGFQMIFFPYVQELKRTILSGDLGKIERVQVFAVWPREDVYYQRSPWSGKMVLNGEVVFDGPATNALIHLLQNVCFILGDSADGFAQPNQVAGILRRARPDILSYDTARIQAMFEDTRVDVFLTHAGEEKIPFRICVKGSNGEASATELSPHLQINGSAITTKTSKHNKEFLYRAIIADEDSFAKMPSKIADSYPSALLAHGALVSSLGCHPVPEHEVKLASDKSAHIKGLNSIVERFGENPDSMNEIPWLRCGQWIDAAKIDNLSDAYFSDLLVQTYQEV
jgi:predicted dehydrogenase